MRAKEGEVRLEKHNPRWRQMFAQELDELWDYFGDYAIRISHIGSTAIDNIEAKPIIDIVVAVKDLDDFSFVSHKFTSNPEYSIKNDFTNEEILIRKGDKNNRSFYIHVMDIDSKRYRDVIFFRDILLHDENVRNDYRDLKHLLAKKYPHNRKQYTTHKADFIETALSMAWAKTTLFPILVIACVALISFITALWARLNVPISVKLFQLYVIDISRIGMFFGGVIFLTTILASGVLYSRYRNAKSHYDKIVSKNKKEIAKEQHKK